MYFYRLSSPLRALKKTSRWLWVCRCCFRCQNKLPLQGYLSRCTTKEAVAIARFKYLHNCWNIGTIEWAARRNAVTELRVISPVTVFWRESPGSTIFMIKIWFLGHFKPREMHYKAYIILFIVIFKEI